MSNPQAYTADLNKIQGHFHVSFSVIRTIHNRHIVYSLHVYECFTDIPRMEYGGHTCAWKRSSEQQMA